MEWLKSRLRSTRAYPKLLQFKKIPFYLRKRISGTPTSARRFCRAPWYESAILCDGSVVCSCFDAFKTMVLGNVERSTFSAIWHGHPYRRLRQAVVAGAERTFLCSTCCFLCERPEEQALHTDFPPDPANFPRLLHIEPTVRCNLRCVGCGLRLAQLSRTRSDLPYDTFTRVLTEVGPHLERLNFYDYGESFLHPKAMDMLRFAKAVNPLIHIVCSTNGHAFRSPDARRDLIETGVDKIIFSVDGASPATYGRYRVGGDFEAVIENMTQLVALKREMGREKPRVQWRYILFTWNDSDEEMALARKLAGEVGVDELRWLLTDHPAECCSRRFAPGRPELEQIRHELD